jgi:VWFA-related protein
VRVVLAVVVGVLALGAGPLRAGQERPFIAPTIDVVAYDVNGRPIDKLQPSDFSIAGSEPRLGVEALRFVRADGKPPVDHPLLPIASADDEQASVRESTRLFAIFLDEFHVTPGAQANRVRDALLRFVRDDLGASDLLVVVKPLDSRLEIRLSRDRAAALRGIETFDPRGADYAPRTAFERTYIAAAPARVDSARAQIATSLLEALAIYLGRFSPARKTLIVVSEGFSKAGRQRGDGLLPGVDSVTMAANRAGVAIYPIDPSDAAAAPARDVAANVHARSDPREVLRSLAEATGGRVTTGAGDVDGGLRRVMADASGYYVLTLTRPLPAGDGRVHGVDVSVRRPGVVLRARRGYWVPSPPTAQSATYPSVSIPFAAQFPRRTSPLIRSWFGMAGAADGATRVSFVWEPTPPVAGERRKGPAPSRVVLSVTKMDGTPVFEGVVLPSGRAVSPSVAGPATRASFETPAGRLLVQMRIEDVASSVVDRDVRDLVVREFRGPVAIGSAEVLRARNAREARALAADGDATPVAGRQFSRNELLIVRASVSSRSGSPLVTSRLMSAMGSTMRALPVSAAPTRPSEFQTEVSLAGLAAGSYSVEVTATGDGGDARETVTFRVTP